MPASVLLRSLLFCGLCAWPGALISGAQGTVAREVYGNITDFKGAPVAGASVSVVNDSRNLVITNSEGRFLLKTKAPEPSLRITSAGYYDTIVVVPSASAAFSAQLRTIANYKRQFKRRYKSVQRAYKK